MPNTSRKRNAARSGGRGGNARDVVQDGRDRRAGERSRPLVIKRAQLAGRWQLPSGRELAEMIKAFRGIADPGVRDGLLALVVSVSKASAKDGVPPIAPIR